MAEQSLFANAEAPKNLAEQIIGAVFAGNPAQCQLGQPEFFGEKFQARQLPPSGVDVLAGFRQGVQMPLASNEDVLGRMPAGNAQQLLPQ